MAADDSQSVADLQDEIELLEEELDEELKEKAAQPLELFFDLVLVFAITQVVSLIVHDLTLAGVLMVRSCSRSCGGRGRTGHGRPMWLISNLESSGWRSSFRCSACSGWRSPCRPRFRETATAIVLVGGLVGGDALQWIWLGALTLEVIATLFAGQATWKIDAGHFAERRDQTPALTPSTRSAPRHSRDCDPALCALR